MEPIKKFYQKVNKASKKEMIQFLTDHFRYELTYANNIKIHTVIPNALRDKVYEISETGELWDYNLNLLIEDFEEQNKGLKVYGAGRSGGYLILNKANPPYAGSLIEEDKDDLEDLDIIDLQERTKQVQLFDQLCDDIVSQTIYMAENYEVKEETYQITKTRKVLVDPENE